MAQSSSRTDGIERIGRGFSLQGSRLELSGRRVHRAAGVGGASPRATCGGGRLPRLSRKTPPSRGGRPAAQAPPAGADEAPDAPPPSPVVSGALFASVWTAHGVR